MGSLGSQLNDVVVFTVVPLNVLVDWIVRTWRWVRYRRASAQEQLLDAAYGRGWVDGRAAEHTWLRARTAQLQQALEETGSELSASEVLQVLLSSENVRSCLTGEDE